MIWCRISMLLLLAALSSVVAPRDGQSEELRLSLPSDLANSDHSEVAKLIGSTLLRQHQSEPTSSSPSLRRWPAERVLTVELRGGIDWTNPPLVGDVVDKSKAQYRPVQWRLPGAEHLKSELLSRAEKIALKIRFIENPTANADIVVVLASTDEAQAGSHSISFWTPNIPSLDKALSQEPSNVAKNGTLDVDGISEKRFCSATTLAIGSQIKFGAALIVTRSTKAQPTTEEAWAAAKCASLLLGVDEALLPDALRNQSEFLLQLLYHPTVPLTATESDLRRWIETTIQ